MSSLGYSFSDERSFILVSAVKGEAKKEKVMTLLPPTGKRVGVPAPLILKLLGFSEPHCSYL